LRQHLAGYCVLKRTRAVASTSS